MNIQSFREKLRLLLKIFDESVNINHEVNLLQSLRRIFNTDINISSSAKTAFVKPINENSIDVKKSTEIVRTGLATSKSG